MAGSSEEQRAVVRREFARQASNFESSGSLFRDTSILEWIASHIEITPDSTILDVAGGTGQLGRHLARAGRGAVIVDLTDAMLATGLRSVQEEGRDDVVFVRGDATALPFPDNQFDVVVSRFALHHMDDPGQAIAEMARVCRDDGSITLIDMVAGGPRHDELGSLLAAAGREPTRHANWDQAMPAEPWLNQAKTPDDDRDRILAVLEDEAEGGAETGLRAARTDDGIVISQRWLLLGG
jgi:ubiquinone/menaquinone biosynthesis C-methylase UbiE